LGVISEIRPASMDNLSKEEAITEEFVFGE
jgi:hypothetical protein